MFGFKKEKNKIEATAPSEPAKPSAEIYTMPDKYVFQTKKSGGGLLLSIIILLLVILVFSTILLFQFFWGKDNVEPVASVPTPAPIIEPLVIDTTNDQTTTTESTSTNDQQATSTDANSDDDSSNIDDNTNGQIILSIDSDNDGLTDAEEVIFGTAPTNPDTDGDGYRDGVEVANGYNPTKAGNSLVTDSPFIISLTTNFDLGNYSLIYPKEWRASFVKDDRQTIISLPTGEVIKISIRTNPDDLSAMSWYLRQYPETIVSRLKLVDNRQATLSGIYSPDGLNAYLVSSVKDRMYVFEYLTGRNNEFRYPAILNMMVKNMSLIADKETSANQNSSRGLGTASIITWNKCSEPSLFCQKTACGSLVSGDNSCTGDLEGYCYNQTCSNDNDCVAGKSCLQVDCYNNETEQSLRLCL